MAKPNPTPPAPPAGAEPPPPAPHDDAAILRAKIAELERQQREQTAAYRTRLAEVTATADAATQRADQLAAREERVRHEATQSAWQSEVDAATDPDGGERRFRCRIPGDVCIFPRVVAASSVGQARERYLKASGIVSTGLAIEAMLTDEPVTAVQPGMYFDVRQQRWVDPNVAALDPELALA